MFLQRYLNIPPISMVQYLTKIRYPQITRRYEEYLKKQAILTGSPVRHFITQELFFSEFGEPLQVLKMRKRNLPELTAYEVLVRMIAAPINPADINTIQGKYPIKLSLPCVAGNEGVGIVEKIGTYVTYVRPGNKVVITTPAQGTWSQFAVFNQSVLKVVPNYLRVAEAATLTVNPCTAYRMLTDFKPVRTCGGVVIQNGANSACGQNVIQLCKAWGIQNINIVRNRPEIKELKSHLQSLGATYVLTEEELRSTTLFKEGIIAKPSLAINCVGGKNSLEVLRHLEPSGCMVTYGGMSKQPVTIPTAEFIFNNLTFYGFWMTDWNEIACEHDKDHMLQEIIALMVDRQLEAPLHKMVKLDKFQETFCKALKGFQGTKHIFDFR